MRGPPPLWVEWALPVRGLELAESSFGSVRLRPRTLMMPTLKYANQAVLVLLLAAGGGALILRKFGFQEFTGLVGSSHGIYRIYTERSAAEKSSPLLEHGANIKKLLFSEGHVLLRSQGGKERGGLNVLTRCAR